jgi:hypothetical protein
MDRFSVFSSTLVRTRVGVLILFSGFAFTLSPISEAASKMPLRPEAKSIDTRSDGIGIFVFRLENQVKEKVVPRVGVVHVYNEADERVATFATKAPGAMGRGSGDMISPLQVISVSLPGGRYTIRKVTGYGMVKREKKKAYQQGRWGFALDESFDIEVGKVVYLGRVDGVITREDKKGEDSVARAGVPLLQMAVANRAAGFGGAYLDFDLSSAFADDMSLLKKRYPWLNTKAIENKSVYDPVPSAPPAPPTKNEPALAVSAPLVEPDEEVVIESKPIEKEVISEKIESAPQSLADSYAYFNWKHDDSLNELFPIKISSELIDLEQVTMPGEKFLEKVPPGKLHISISDPNPGRRQRPNWEPFSFDLQIDDSDVVLIEAVTDANVGKKIITLNIYTNGVLTDSFTIDSKR